MWPRESSAPALRPANPIGLHRVRVITVEGSRDLLHGLEALDETPLADAKPVLDKAAER